MRNSLFAFCFTVGFCWAPNPSWATDDPVQTKAQHTQQLKRLRQDILAIKKRMQATQGERNKLGQTLEKSEQRIGQFTRQLRDLRQQRKQTQKQLAQLQQQAQQQHSTLQKERQILRRQVRAAHAMGRQEQVKMLLNQQDPSQVSRMLTYYSYINRQRIQRVHEVRDHLVELNTTQQQITARQQQLQQVENQQNRQKQNVLAEQKTRRQLLAKLDSALQSQGQKLKQLRTDEKRLAQLLKDLQKALTQTLADVGPGKKFQAMRGRLNWPTQGRLSARFGAPKIGELRWDGVMITAPAGREIRATHHGRVVFADWLRGFGLLLIIDHSDGYMSLYGHNQSLFKEVGDQIKAGEPIAAVGNTGGRKQTGVYFAIRHNGRAINPARWCKKTRGNRVG